MSFQQVRFFGASVQGFTGSVGWNEQQGTLTVNLVEDVAGGDHFNPPDIGSPVYFVFDQFKYGGLLQSWEQQNSTDGRPVYSVIITDPREILDGTQIILDAFNGSVLGTPNLLNAFGYWEKNAFGASQINEGGMPWNLISSAIIALVNTPNPLFAAYGSPLQFRGATYLLDISQLPFTPLEYRIGGVSIGLMELITQVCQDAGLDYFVRLLEGNIIQILTVSRVQQPPLGQIADFIGNSDGANATSIGQELRNETATTFLVGGQVCNLYQQAQSNLDPGLEELNTIWPFWGYDAFGNAIVGHGDFNSTNHSFDLDSRMLNIIGVGETYPADIGELRAAIAGEEEWRSYVEVFQGFKAAQIGITGRFSPNSGALDAIYQGNIFNPIIAENSSNQRANRTGSRHIDPEFVEQNIHNLFEFVSSFAQDYYGKKFMVRVPFVLAKVEPDTFNVFLSQEPTEGGWIGEGDQPLGLPVFFEDIFTTQDGRFEAFVRFDALNNGVYDMSQLDPNETVVANDALFVKVGIEPVTVFLDAANFISPRVVISLPQSINILPGSGQATFDAKDWYKGLELAFGKKLFDQGRNPTPGLTDIQKEALNRSVGFGAGGTAYWGMAPLAALPNYTAVPLKSNLLTYGPWSIAGPAGRVRFERDESLVPWNYGGYETMNFAAIARVQESVTFMQVGEMGSVRVPGTPTIQLGDVLQLGGPNVTAIDVSIGVDGVISNYRMRTYTPKFGQFARQNADRFTRLSRAAQQFRRGMRQLFRAPAPPGVGAFTNRERAFIGKNGSPLFSPRSPHTIIVGQTMQYLDDPKSRQAMVAEATFNEALGSLQAQNSEDYQASAMMSLDGLFRPYSTDTENQFMGHFETPSGGYPNVNNLNPWQSGNKTMTDIAIASYGDEYPNNGSDSLSTANPFFDNSTIRGIALRAPLVLTGWGFDINGLPVPNSNPDHPTANFLDGYRNQSQKWKTGPLDARWDDTRKVWVATGQSEVLAVVIYLSGGFLPVGGRPVYVVRKAKTMFSGGVIVIDNFTGIAPMDSPNDLAVVNIQEGVQDLHTLAVGTPVLVHSFNGVNFLNEHVRTMVQRNL